MLDNLVALTLVALTLVAGQRPARDRSCGQAQGPGPRAVQRKPRAHTYGYDTLKIRIARRISGVGNND